MIINLFLLLLLLLLLFVFPGCQEHNIVSALASVQVLIICASARTFLRKCESVSLEHQSARSLEGISSDKFPGKPLLDSSDIFPRAEKRVRLAALINRACSKAMSACEKCPPTGRLHLQRFEWNAISIFYILRYPQFVAQNLFKKVTNQRYIYVGTVQGFDGGENLLVWLSQRSKW